MRRNRRRASAIQTRNERALSLGGHACIFVSKALKQRGICIGATLDGQDSLPCSRYHIMHIEFDADALTQTKPTQTGRCQYDGTELPLIKLPQTRLHVSADALETGLRIQAAQLQLAARR